MMRKGNQGLGWRAGTVIGAVMKVIQSARRAGRPMVLVAALGLLGADFRHLEKQHVPFERRLAGRAR